MIKIIKQGKIKKFVKTCQYCDCEFEYDDSDLNADCGVCPAAYPPKYGLCVVCPCCGKRVYHGTAQATDLTIVPLKLYYDCDKCQNKPDPDRIAVGDTPCARCKKLQPCCFDAVIDCTGTSRELRGCLEPVQAKVTSE